MRLDLPTLSVATIFVAALAGALLTFSWWQSRDNRALAWWGASLLLGAGASVLFLARGAVPDVLSIAVGNAILYAACGALWVGFRRFEGRPTPLALVLAGSFLWIAACGVPDFYRSFPARVLLGSSIGAAYTLAAAWEVWRGRREPLMSRVPLALLLVLHAVALMSRYPVLQAAGDVEGATIFAFPGASFYFFKTLFFTVALAFLLLCMAKERSELHQRTAASLDPLTGALNRRAFLAEGRALLDRDRRAGRSAALLVVDLDHFKRVNDRFGHAVGDEVLRRFCETAREALPHGALLARLGGEEFGILLSGAGPGEAGDLAESLRDGFARARLEADGAPFRVTLSVGVATTDEVGHVLEGLMAGADLTLYRAKENGRDRVEQRLAMPEFVEAPVALAA